MSLNAAGNHVTGSAVVVASVWPVPTLVAVVVFVVISAAKDIAAIKARRPQLSGISSSANDAACPCPFCGYMSCVAELRGSAMIWGSCVKSLLGRRVLGPDAIKFTFV